MASNEKAAEVLWRRGGSAYDCSPFTSSDLLFIAGDTGSVVIDFDSIIVTYETTYDGAIELVSSRFYAV